MSSPSERPKEIVPSPIPFSPFSNSSSSLKLRGTAEAMDAMRVGQWRRFTHSPLAIFATVCATLHSENHY